jgi:glycosyltransferase involved in cell wall biosynthesis
LSPKVSVIIPTFNRGHLIDNAIQSVLNQTFRDFEIIVVDDGSTDNTREVVSKYKDKVVYIFQENCERSSARNKGIKQSSGQFITFLDSDDLYLSDKLKVQVESMEQNPDFGMSYSYSIWFDELGRYLHTWRDTLNGWIYPEMMLAKHNRIAVPSVMIRRSVIDTVGYFNELISTCEDYEYWCRIARKYQVLLIKKGLVVINTKSQPSLDLFYNYFNSTLSYYIAIFVSDRSIKEQMKRAIFTDLAVKYYLNSASGKDKKYILSEINKIRPSYGLVTIIKSHIILINKVIWKYNGFSTLLRFLNNYLLVSLPRSIMAEDFEYGVLGELKSTSDVELISTYYRKNKSENIYAHPGHAGRVTRKKIREVLIASGYLNRNRIAMIMKM